MSETILVTGGSGFIGSALVRHLVRETGYGAVAVDKLTYAGSRVSVEAVASHPRYRGGLPDGRAEAFRFVHVSTDEVFGELGEEGAFTESSAYDPRSPYAASKAASDHLARAWHHTYDLPLIVTHSSDNYGPWHYPEKLVPLAIPRALRGEHIPVCGDGRNVRDWIHVEGPAVAEHAELIRSRGSGGSHR